MSLESIRALGALLACPESLSNCEAGGGVGGKMGGWGQDRQQRERKGVRGTKKEERAAGEKGRKLSTPGARPWRLCPLSHGLAHQSFGAGTVVNPFLSLDLPTCKVSGGLKWTLKEQMR